MTTSCNPRSGTDALTAVRTTVQQRSKPALFPAAGNLEPVHRGKAPGLFPCRHRTEDRACARRHRGRRQLLLIQANGAILKGDAEAAIAAITGSAERVFAFTPSHQTRYRPIGATSCAAWLLGQPLAAAQVRHRRRYNSSREVSSIAFPGPWRRSVSRGRANGDTVGDIGLRLEDHRAWPRRPRC